VAPWSSKSLVAVRFLQQRCRTEGQSSEFIEHQNHMRSSKTGTLHSRKLFEPFRFISRSALKLPEGIHEKVWQRVHLKTLRSFLGHIDSIEEALGTFFILGFVRSYSAINSETEIGVSNFRMSASSNF